MELLTNIIIGYLKHNKRLVVPKFGVFIVKQPEGTIIFSELMRSDDGVLRSLLVAYGCNELAANGMIDRFSFEIRHKLSRGESYVIPDFGEFTEAENNTIRFKHKREPKVFGGTIKPPVERFDDEKLKLQRIQRIRQQQSENITGHSTHRKLKSSHVIATTSRRATDEAEIDMGKPDKYLRGLKYENRKGRNSDEERFGGNERQMRNKGGLTMFLLIAAIALAVGGWFTWQWTNKQRNDITPIEQASEVAPAIEVIDTLAPPATELNDEEKRVPEDGTHTPSVTPMAVPQTTPTTFFAPVISDSQKSMTQIPLRS